MKRTDLIKLISPLPSSIWGHILLRAGNGKVEAISVSDTLSMSMSMPCDDKPWSVAPKCDTLKTALSGLTGDDVALDIGDTLQIASKGKRRVACIKVSLFPELPKIAGDAVTVSGRQLREAIAFVRGCAYSKIDKPHLVGVHFNGNDVVASNGSVLRHFLVDAKLPKVTIPPATAALLVKILPDGDVSVKANERQLCVEWDSGSLTTGLAPAGFPPAYADMLRNWSGNPIEAQADELSRAVSAVSAFAGSVTKPIYINCGNNITLSCSDAEEPLDMVPWPHEPRKILLNGGMLAEMLNAYGKDVVTVTLKPGQVDPLLFSDSSGRKGILLPMRQ
jgi:DNA polymerase III sliding clamp (beta) subunit (PCNA family)